MPGVSTGGVFTSNHLIWLVETEIRVIGEEKNSELLKGQAQPHGLPAVRGHGK